MQPIVRNEDRLRNATRSISKMDEEELLQGIIQGNTATFEIFYKLYYPKLFRFILRMTHQRESVEELIQETMLMIWENPTHYNHESKISTWVFGIAYYKTLKSMSKHAHRISDIDIDELKETLSDPVANPSQQQENVDWINNALGILSPEHRAVIELTFYHDLAYQEIAKILNCPENTVKTRMFYARKKLQSFAETLENE